jgi:hypothetical protein
MQFALLRATLQSCGRTCSSERLLGRTKGLNLTYGSAVKHPLIVTSEDKQVCSKVNILSEFSGYSADRR